jgi:hypothetical protein
LWRFNCVGEAYGGYGWCATSHMYSGKDWGGCRKNHPPAQRYIAWPEYDKKAYKLPGKNSAPDDKCAIPFRHEGVMHYNCINPSPKTKYGWCSLDKQFKGRWGSCAIEGYKPFVVKKGIRYTDGKKGTARPWTRCQFPFQYKGKNFHGCVQAGSKMHPHGWCATTSIFMNKWGSCAPAGKAPPKRDCRLAPWSVWTRGDPRKSGCTASARHGGSHCAGTTRLVLTDEWVVFRGAGVVG